MKSNRLTKAMSFMLAIMLCLWCIPLSAFATEVEDNIPEIQTIEEAGITREEAIEVLGLSHEEAQDVKFYALRSTNQLVLNSGDTHKFPTFTFTSYNVGSYFTVNANKIMYGVIWEIKDGQPAATLEVKLYPYGEPCAYTAFIRSEMDGGDKRYTTKSEWINAYNGVDYHFVYEAKAWTGDDRPVTSSVTMVIGVV